MAVIGWYAFLGIECDYPGCKNGIIINDQCPGPMYPDGKILKSLGWEMSEFPNGGGGQGFLTLCPCCKKKELPADMNKNDHNCIYCLETKTGKPSHYGSVRRCVICGGTS
jgi:hypothetical protein